MKTVATVRRWKWLAGFMSWPLLAGMLVVFAVAGAATDTEGECPGVTELAAVQAQPISIPGSVTGELEALRAAGITVVEVPGWQSRSHGPLPDAPAIVWHHDGSDPGDSPGVLDWMVSNWDVASAQVWIDRAGAWHIVGDLGGKANHAGQVLPGAIGNADSIGIETDHTVGEDWPAAQLQSLRKGTAALFTLWGRDPADALTFHKAVAPWRKVDPDGLDLAAERITVGALMPKRQVQQALRGGQAAFTLPTAAVASAADDGSIIDGPVNGSTIGGGGGGAGVVTSGASQSGACPTSQVTGASFTSRDGGAGAAFDPGNIIADEVFYNSTSMTVAQIREFVAEQNKGCTGNSWCAATMKVTLPGRAADQYCQAIPALTGDAADAIGAVSTACGVNPQVMLTTWKKESKGLSETAPTASSYAAAWGWHCPDTGAGGSANCDPQYAGFTNQLVGMANQWARYRVDIPSGKYRHGIGTYDIMWNVAESGCGSAPVTIKNLATASLYNYTPYQPNAAALEAYPGVGDECSTYGNRNFFKMFQKYFGDTGGGQLAGGVTAAPAPGGEVKQVNNPSGTGAGASTAKAGPVAVPYSGVTVGIPDHPNVAEQIRGKTIVAPSPEVAAALATGLTWVGTPYSWGGGTADGPTSGICESGAAWNDCHIVGFDCSGLTEYVAAKWGASIPGTSRPQRDASKGVAWEQMRPGDIIGWSSHVAVYLGSYGGQQWMLEAPESGSMVQVSKVRGGHDSVAYRYWPAGQQV